MPKNPQTPCIDCGEPCGKYYERCTMCGRHARIKGTPDEDKICELNDAGMMQREIAAELGCTLITVSRVLRRKRRGRSAFHIKAAERRAAVLKYGDDRDWNCTAVEIEEATGVCSSQIYNIARRNGKKLKPIPRPTPQPVTHIRPPKPITVEDSPEARARKLAAWKKHFSAKAAA